MSPFFFAIIRVCYIKRLFKMITYAELNKNWKRTHPKQKEPLYYFDGITKEINDNNLKYTFIGFNINSYEEFNGARTKLVLKCSNPEHEEFYNCTFNNFTKPGSGRRCPQCSNEKVSSFHRSNTEEFIKKVTLVHNGFYDYSKVVYGKNAHEKVEVICPKHGEFYISPAKHYNSAQGCSKCAEEKRLLDSEDVKNRINFIHKGHFEFGDFQYNGCHEKIKVICKATGKSYKTTPNTLLQGYGCKFCHCQAEHTFETFVAMANEKHNNKYYYHLVEEQFVGLRNYVDVLCSDHGIFTVLPTNHIHGRANGCPKCADYGYNGKGPGFFYLQKLMDKKNNVIAYKFGITKRLAARIVEQQKTSIYKHEYIKHLYFEDGQIPIKLEKYVDSNIESSYITKNELGNGYTETYNPKYHEKVLQLIEDFLK